MSRNHQSLILHVESELSNNSKSLNHNFITFVDKRPWVEKYKGKDHNMLVEDSRNFLSARNVCCLLIFLSRSTFIKDFKRSNGQQKVLSFSVPHETFISGICLCKPVGILLLLIRKEKSTIPYKKCTVQDPGGVELADNASAQLLFLLPAKKQRPQEYEKGPLATCTFNKTVFQEKKLV